MDPIDRRIVAALQADANMSHAALAEQVGSSPASCWRRVRALEAAGVFVRTVRLVDQTAIGLGVNVMCNVRMRSHESNARRNFETFIDDCPEVIECYSMSGDWDYLLRIVAIDVADYNAFLMGRLLNHPSVDGGSSHFALSMTKYTTALPV
ncbi:Lrp/AsnC family transcriptional regulator [Sphingomonas sp. MG17]|uniref:Lrp/AsnC family transcriptional regulator n=1 Tax=Sphingomonas tagetis TaxID=2949092 RepID=A0A9X2HNV1_9SPHN|nr:Lrp/AsnC family transcriptional regulator [Sphingomonas tagetis]MCP3732719.1 Lrp/AsnC family transcriptional regulator [Sphingomonas tagetis]